MKGRIGRGARYYILLASLIFKLLLAALFTAGWFYFGARFIGVLSAPIFGKIPLFSIIWAVLLLEIVSRLVPPANNPFGGGRLFAKNAEKAAEPEKIRRDNKSAAIVLALWAGLFVIYGAGAFILSALEIFDLVLFAYFTVLWLNALASAFVLIFCPFRAFILKNKCCATCRIANWDSLMIVCPLILTPRAAEFVLLAAAAGSFLLWEYAFFKRPGHFYESTNPNLRCEKCKIRCLNLDK